MSDLPTGTVTFLFTDLEVASYPLDTWEQGFRVNVTGALICTLDHAHLTSLPT